MYIVTFFSFFLTLFSMQNCH
jgi:hypothetical protein